jgi:hypothetical protein
MSNLKRELCSLESASKDVPFVYPSSFINSENKGVEQNRERSERKRIMVVKHEEKLW